MARPEIISPNHQDVQSPGPAISMGSKGLALGPLKVAQATPPIINSPTADAPAAGPATEAPAAGPATDAPAAGPVPPATAEASGKTTVSGPGLAGKKGLLGSEANNLDLRTLSAAALFLC